MLAVLFQAGIGLSGMGWFSPTGIEVFCQAMLGLGLAEGIAGFEALPVTRAVARRDHVWSVIRISALVAVALIVLPIVVSIAGGAIGGGIFGEESLGGHTSELSLPSEPWRIFLMMLAGAGIAEETPYRLVVLSLAWRLTARRGLAIAIAAVVFGLYHLSPLNSWYDVYWHAPITQMVTSTTGGLILGYVFTRRGYETTVMGHTLGNVVLFSLFARG